MPLINPLARGLQVIIYITIPEMTRPGSVHCIIYGISCFSLPLRAHSQPPEIWRVAKQVTVVDIKCKIRIHVYTTLTLLLSEHCDCPCYGVLPVQHSEPLPVPLQCSLVLSQHVTWLHRLRSMLCQWEHVRCAHIHHVILCVSSFMYPFTHWKIRLKGWCS